MKYQNGVLIQARVESFPPEVQLSPSKSEGPRWACPLPAEECLLLKERGAGGEGPQGAGAAVRGGQVQHAHIPLPLRDFRLHHAGRNPGLSLRTIELNSDRVHIVQARLEIGPYDMAVHTPAFFRQNLVSWHLIHWQWTITFLIFSIKEYSWIHICIDFYSIMSFHLYVRHFVHFKFQSRFLPEHAVRKTGSILSWLPWSASAKTSPEVSFSKRIIVQYLLLVSNSKHKFDKPAMIKMIIRRDWLISSRRFQAMPPQNGLWRNTLNSAGVFRTMAGRRTS